VPDVNYITGGQAAAVSHGFTSCAKEVMFYPCPTLGCSVIDTLGFRDTEGLSTILIQNFMLLTILSSHSYAISIKRSNRFRPLQHRPGFYKQKKPGHCQQECPHGRLRAPLRQFLGHSVLRGQPVLYVHHYP
jgi:hypothetical protein